MILHSDISSEELWELMRSCDAVLGGNKRLRIFGRLDCALGKRMKRENRVFFSSKEEAIEMGYRPCGYCLKVDYHEWKGGNDG